MLSVIMQKGEKTPTLQKLCSYELRGEDHEIIICDDWLQGLEASKGEYVTFLESKFALSDDYFTNLLDVFLDQPSFRKMAMVAPSTAKVFWGADKRIYGYRLSAFMDTTPSFVRSSTVPYTVQMAYLPGAIIRKAILKDLSPDFGHDILADSLYISLNFWLHGLRILVNPRVTYFTDNESIDVIGDSDLPDGIEDLMLMFKREMI